MARYDRPPGREVLGLGGGPIRCKWDSEQWSVPFNAAVSKRLICYPQGATVTDGRDAFVAWGQKNLANKERMDEIAVVGLVRALAERYPCR
jgi:hypothetical protein